MKPPKRIPRISAKKLKALGGKMPFSSVAPSSKPKPLPRSAPKQKARKPIAKIGKQKAKRQARNREYYASAEWRAKRKAVFARDGYQCAEVLTIRRVLCFQGEELASGTYKARCQNRGEIVNGKQTARGLVCEEVSYRHRGVADYIDTCKTRCKDCDRRCTPLERANHAQGFSARRGRNPTL